MEKNKPRPKPSEYVRPSANKLAAMEQDKAAGSAEARKMRTVSGDIVTVSLSISSSGDASRIILRFKMGGSTVERTVGSAASTSRPETLKQGWKMLRDQTIVEKEGWSWVVPTSSD